MKTKLFLLLPVVALLAFTPASTTTKLTVKVDNIKGGAGKIIYVSVFTKGTFPMGKAKYDKSIAASGSNVSVTFELPNGDYAVALYHDLNSNKTLDQNLIGIPKEPYGFSRNFKPSVSAPDFSDCSFTLSGTEKKLSISLIQ